MKLVVQEDLMGCGLACVASRIGLTYQETKDRFSHPDHATWRGYYCKGLVLELAKHGLAYRFKKVTSVNRTLLDVIGSIVFIERADPYFYGHWLLKTEQGWMNSWVNPESELLEAKSAYQKVLPGKPEWIVYPI